MSPSQLYFRVSQLHLPLSESKSTKISGYRGQQKIIYAQIKLITQFSIFLVHWNGWVGQEVGSTCCELRLGWDASQVALVVKNHPAKAGYARSMGSIPGSGRSPGGGDPLQYSCLENPMDRGTWQATVHRAAQSQARLKWLSTHTYTHGGTDRPLNNSAEGDSLIPSVQVKNLSWVDKKELNCMSLSSPLTHLVRSLQSHQHILPHKSNWTGGPILWPILQCQERRGGAKLILHPLPPNTQLTC